MSVTTVTHLNFRGDARAALEFYRSVTGGDLLLVTYEDAHNVQDPAEADQIMWGQVTADSGFHVMAYDVPSTTSYDPGDKPFFLSLRGETAEEVIALWEKLSQGSNVVVPLAPAPHAPLYGMLIDPHGVTWVVDVIAPYTV